MGAAYPRRYPIAERIWDRIRSDCVQLIRRPCLYTGVVRSLGRYRDDSTSRAGRGG